MIYFLLACPLYIQSLIFIITISSWYIKKGNLPINHWTIVSLKTSSHSQVGGSISTFYLCEIQLNGRHWVAIKMQIQICISLFYWLFRKFKINSFILKLSWSRMIFYPPCLDTFCSRKRKEKTVPNRSQNIPWCVEKSCCLAIKRMIPTLWRKSDSAHHSAPTIIIPSKWAWCDESAKYSMRIQKNYDHDCIRHNNRIRHNNP